MLLSLLAKSFGGNQWNCLAHRSLNGFFIAVVDSRTAYTELLPKSNTIFKGNPLPFICSYWSRNSSAAVFINNPTLSAYDSSTHISGEFPLQYEYTILEYIISVFRKQINGLPLHIINAKHCISSTQSVVSHQAAVLCTPVRGDIQPQRGWWYAPHYVRWWYTKPAAWIKK